MMKARPLQYVIVERKSTLFMSQSHLTIDKNVSEFFITQLFAETRATATLYFNPLR